VGRSNEMIRQWKLLQRLASRRGSTIPSLAAELNVTTRTIRRDLTALQEAGFPVWDDDGEGKKHWRLDPNGMAAALARNALTVQELCALYTSRAVLKGVAGSEALGDLQSALGKLEAALPRGVRRFLDRLPAVVTAKAMPGRRRGAGANDFVTKLFDAALGKRVVSMRYDSQHSGGEKDYMVHPYRLVYVQNAVYLQAFVPAYAEIRTFLIDRIRRLTIEERTFEPIGELGTDAFSKSLGAFSGPACKVQLRFAAAVASFIKDRLWHESQQCRQRPDGSLVLTMQVTDDFALRQWILGFGRSVRVLAPASLAEWTAGELEQACEQYRSGRFAAMDSDVQPALPFLFGTMTTT